MALKNPLTKEERAALGRQAVEAIMSGMMNPTAPFVMRTAEDFDRPGDPPPRAEAQSE